MADPFFVAPFSSERPITLESSVNPGMPCDQEMVLLSAIVNASDDAIISKTLDGIITSWNPAAERMFGYTAREIVGKPKTVLFPPERLSEEAMILDRLRQGIATDHFETVRLRKDGTPIEVSVTISPICDNEGHIIGASTIARDITENRQLHAQLKEHIARIEAQNVVLEALATTDGLTGLKNHRAFQERLREEYARTVRTGTPLSVLLLDVDQFKQYNDTYGHPGGDAVLRLLAQILQGAARTCDVVARYGGEEFAILLPGTTMEQATCAGERFRHLVEAASWPARAVTVSIGAATFLPAMLNSDALLADADTALYRSKHQGRNRVTHAADVVKIELVDAESVSWYDNLLEQLKGVETEVLGFASEEARTLLYQAYEATIDSWGYLLGCKGVETMAHSERVANMMVRLMRHLGFNEQETLFAKWGARLHDIGTMAVPDYILNKPGSLIGDEWVIMRSHTTVAHQMLASIKHLRPALDIPYCHHERWDGSGYPRGLQGEDIPLMARIFAVVDVYEALTHDRPYRNAWSENMARQYLLEKSGTQFDPRAVHALLSLLATATEEETGTDEQAA